MSPAFLILRDNEGMQAKWVIVVLFYALLILAVAQPSPHAFDLLWISVSFAVMIVLSAGRVVSWLWSGRLDLPYSGALRRFLTDSGEQPAHRK